MCVCFSWKSILLLFKMYLITKSSSLKSILSPASVRRVYRGLSSQTNLTEKDQENEEKKAKQQKYQELEKLQYRPLYLDAQATTPMVKTSFERMND